MKRSIIGWASAAAVIVSSVAMPRTAVADYNSEGYTYYSDKYASVNADNSENAEIYKNMSEFKEAFTFSRSGTITPNQVLNDITDVMFGTYYSGLWEYLSVGVQTNSATNTSNVMVNTKYLHTKEQEDVLNQKADEILKSIITPDMSEAQKVKAIYDYIVFHSAYSVGDNQGFTQSGISVYSPYAIISDGYGVCQAYSLLNHKLLEKAGIEVLYVFGSAYNGQYSANHAWNLVKLDGQWYHSDPTWGDFYPDYMKKVHYAYYMKSDSEFSKDHTWDRTIYPAANGSLSNVLENISVKGPAKTDYIVGQNLEISGLSVLGTYLDGTRKALPVSMENISGFDSSAPATGREVIVTVEGKTAKFKVNVVANTLESIEVAGPAKMEYIVGQSLDISGLSVIGTYLDGTRKALPVSLDNISGFDSSAPATGREVTVAVDGRKAKFTVSIADIPSVSFVDTVGHWASKHIDELSNSAIISGYEDNTFRPESLISREEAAQMLSNYIGGNSMSAEVPPDSLGRWSTGAIQNLLGMGIISGYADGTFRPENKITRAEFATMFYNMMHSEGKLGSSMRSFEDLSDHWAKQAVESLAGNGIIDGYGDGSFKPGANITRAEAATIMSKSLSKK